MGEDIRAKIIQIIIENQRLNLLYMKDLATFIKEKFEPELKIYKMRKPEIIGKATEYLTPDNLLLFTDIPRFGLLQKDVAEILNIGKSSVNRLINSEEIHIKDTVVIQTTPRITCNICKIQDVINVYNNRNFLLRKAYVPKQLESTDDNLAQALYIINKSAKVSRDTKNDSYYNKKFGVCKAAKTRMLKHYHLKDEAMQKLIDENRMELIGYNKQVFYGEEQWLKLYKLGDFTFHIPCDCFEKVNPNMVLSEIDGLISSDKKRKVEFNYKDAIHLLEEYSGASY